MGSSFHQIHYESPIDLMEIIGTEEAICSIMFSEKMNQEHPTGLNTPLVLNLCVQELDEYFKGTRHEFTFPYTFEGTSFQKTVWTALKGIPYAYTASYKDLAVSIGNEKAIRAVGSANGKNRLSIVIPCHRIIGTNGKLTGYAGGLWRKEWLLQHEKILKKE
ncbi:methylated-DNA--[protein]-cysteine S-methyltransferase [Ureibacillus sinduriensis]|uniref:Methylated-DNA--protein-cysteine methyltransferase n=1 Tax=Ureibacillus sinduriensis BLB-1 = JCM 15800 TaxID=1384057 RepID=A0A0A3HU73_9BACL|nr:methylated-DNA--[protein]-cysteine S-methyltransferase [Ureibacillus sinduriensis]KGR76151.1 cysteine methyltransferase [Ureibacillus sinduriensis BLB-1 = JCM 15800]